MLDHIPYREANEFTPSDRIPATGHTIVDFHVARFAGARSPGGCNHQINDNVNGHHVAQVILFADYRAEETVADR